MRALWTSAPGAAAGTTPAIATPPEDTTPVAESHNGSAEEAIHVRTDATLNGSSYTIVQGNQEMSGAIVRDAPSTPWRVHSTRRTFDTEINLAVDRELRTMREAGLITPTPLQKINNDNGSEFGNNPATHRTRSPSHTEPAQTAPLQTATGIHITPGELQEFLDSMASGDLGNCKPPLPLGQRNGPRDPDPNGAIPREDSITTAPATEINPTAPPPSARAGQRNTSHINWMPAPNSKRVLDRNRAIREAHLQTDCPHCNPLPQRFTLANSLASKAQTKAKSKPEALTDALPYGKNPPLPNEVMEALQVLKNMHVNLPESLWTAEQLDDVRATLAEKRPAWANCLTMQHMEQVADPETEQVIRDLMDKPVYQTSIFSKCMETPADFREYDLPQKPGEDYWNPQQHRRYKNPATYKIIDDWLEQLLMNRKIRASRATRPAVLTVVEKEGREPRVCIDYRLRNSRTEIPAFPMPDVHDHLDDAVGFKYYCSFDMQKMFNQFTLKEEDRHLAAFITHRGVFEPNVVMFGLGGGPQHAVREVGGAMYRDPLTNGQDFTKWALQQNAQGETPPYEINPSTKIVPGSRLEPFVDDVNIKSNHKKGMVKQVELFFEFCRKHSLILSSKKVKLMKPYLKMLGMVVSEHGKHLDPSRIATLLEAIKPRSKETLHALLGSYNFIRMFIPNFSLIASPLYEATKGIVWKGPKSGKVQGIHKTDPDFVWSAEMTRAYGQLQNALLEAPILVAPDWNLPLFLSVDASLRGEGWVLWQLIAAKDGVKVAVPIVFGSRKYTDTERAWETTRQEATAIKSAIEDVDCYIFGQHFYLLSDHLNLRFMHNSDNRAVIRMRHFLSQYKMTVVHVTGQWNNADGISRLETDQLPVDLMSTELNSAQTANLKKNQLLISIGTDTGLDSASEGNSLLQPKHTCADCKQITSECNCTPEAKRESARVLLTTVSTKHGACIYSDCLLCSQPKGLQEQEDIPDLIETSDSESEDEDPFQNPRCFATKAANIQLNSHLDDDDFLHHLEAFRHNTGSTVSIDALLSEAAQWNNHRDTTIASLRPSLVDDLPQKDLEDEEDLLWCDSFDRKATVFRTAAANWTAKRKETRGKRTLLGPRTKSSKHQCHGIPRVDTTTKQLDEAGAGPSTPPIVPVSPDSSDEDSDNPQGPQPVASLTTGQPQELSIPREIIDQGSQTCPADFRQANIKFPNIEDFKAIHNGISGHHGLEHSYRKLFVTCGSKWANERGAVRKIKAELKEFLDNCPVCQKVRGLKEKEKCKHSFIISRPFLETSYDIIVFTRPDKNGKQYIIVAIDNFTKLVELKAVEHKDAESAAQFLVEVASRYGHCARLRSDRDAAFTGLLVRYLNERRGTQTLACVPYRPEANSVCERQNAIVMAHLTALTMGCELGPNSKVGWSDLLPFIFSIINNTPKSPLGISPLSMVYGQFANYDRPLLPTGANTPGKESNPVDYVEALMAWQEKLLDIAEDIQSKHLKRMQEKYAKGLKSKSKSNESSRSFNQGDFVIQKKDSTGRSGKLTPRWIGPFLVLERRENDPTHPVLDLMNLTDMTVKEAATDDCRIFLTGWFDEATMLDELTKIAAADLDEFVVETILDHKPDGPKRTLPLSKYTFLVKWKDFEEPTWEPYVNLKSLTPFEEYSLLHPHLKLT